MADNLKNINKIEFNEVQEDTASETKGNKNSNLMETYLNQPYYSKIQIQIIIINSIVMFMDGVHMTLMSSILIPIKNAFFISDMFVSLISSFMYILVGLASYISGFPYITKNKAYYVKTSFLILFVSTGCMSIFFNIYIFIICRIVQGICVGLTMPICISILCEVMPINKRSPMLIFTGVFFLIGSCFNCVTAYLILPENLEGGKLYIVFCILTIISLFSYIYVNKYFVDSPRSLILKGEDEIGFEILSCIINNIDYYNNDEFCLERGREVNFIITEEAKKDIKNQILESNKNQEAELSTLFNSNFRKTTILLILITTVNAFVLYGSTFITSIAFKKIKEVNGENSETKTPDKINSILIEQMIVYLFTFPSLIIAGYLSEHKLFGRKRTMAFGYGLTFIFIILGFFNLKHFFYFFGLSAFFITLSFQSSATYYCEIYPTKIRSLSLGFHNLNTRIAGFFSQPVAVYLTNINYLGQFWFSLVLCIVGFYCSLVLPVDTRGRNLDSLEGIS